MFLQELTSNLASVMQQSAYQNNFVGMGMVGSESEGNENSDMAGIGLPGPQGFPGLNGQSGAPGMDGQDGEDGLMGVPGLAGTAGTPGSPGSAGANGSMGVPGMDGTDGDDSMSVYAPLQTILFPLVKTSTDTVEILSIPSGFQFLCAGDFTNNGAIVNLGSMATL